MFYFIWAIVSWAMATWQYLIGDIGFTIILATLGNVLLVIHSMKLQMNVNRILADDIFNIALELKEHKNDRH